MKANIYDMLNSIHNQTNIFLDWHSTRPMVKAIRNSGNDKGLVGAEIGVLYGLHAATIFRNLNIKKLYLIDTYEEYGNYGFPAKRNRTGNLIREMAKHRLRKHDNKLIWIQKYSNDAINDVPDDLDFVYIDGNHEYQYVSKDIELYYPKVKKGGFIGGHDINNPEVVWAVTDFLRANNKTDFHIFRHDWWHVK